MKSLIKWLCHKPTIGASAFAAGENAKQPSTSRIIPNVMLNFFIFNFPFVCCLALVGSHREKSLLAVHCCTARRLSVCYGQSGRLSDFSLQSSGNVSSTAHGQRSSIARPAARKATLFLQAIADL